MAMEATGTDGGCGAWIYSYGLGVGNPGYSPFSIGSSSSGTIVSTAYTPSGSSSGLSSVSPYTEAPMAFRNGHYAKLEKIRKQQHIKSLVQEFFYAGVTVGEGYCPNGRMKVLERWFTELGVRWVLQLDDGGVAPAVTHDYARSWVSGLFEITDTIHLMVASFSELRDEFQFVQFIQKAMLKMLAFVDVLVARNAEMPPWYDKLSSLVSVHGALSKALSEIPMLYTQEVIWMLFPDINREQVQEMVGEIINLLEAKLGKAAETVSTTIQHITSSEVTGYLYVDDDSLSSQGTPEIQKATRSVMRYITFLQSNYSSMAPFVSQALASILIGDKSVQPLDSMAVEVTSCLQEKLVKVSESFPDQGLRFLFLLNNSSFILKNLLCCFKKYNPSLDIHVASLTEKADHYKMTYLQESWEPVLSCLQFNPFCLFRIRSNSALTKFVSVFQKTYTTQKLWKVPDPKIRKSLRTAIIEKIIPDYTKYIEENNIAMPKFTPKEMEEMLQELFEG